MTEKTENQLDTEYLEWLAEVNQNAWSERQTNDKKEEN